MIFRMIYLKINLFLCVVYLYPFEAVEMHKTAIGFW